MSTTSPDWSANMNTLRPHNRKGHCSRHQPTDTHRGNWYQPSHLSVGLMENKCIFQNVIEFSSFHSAFINTVTNLSSNSNPFSLRSCLPVHLGAQLQTQSLILILETMSAKRCLLITNWGLERGNNWHSHPVAPVPYPSPGEIQL